MCGRYTLTDPKAVAEAMLRDFGVIIDSGLARYNVAPSQLVPIIRGGESGRMTAVQMRWGMVPNWDKSPKPKITPINVRSEEAFTKPLFRQPLQCRRALLPCDGFFEWQASKIGPKVPYYIQVDRGRPFVIAAIYEDATELRPEASCALLTVGPNDVMAPIHNRMPVILDVDVARRWLQPRPLSAEEMAALCRPYSSGEMTAHPVSRAVNNVRNDAPECVAAVSLN
jgi:putative SOS response-associated peptidase YedK